MQGMTDEELSDEKFRCEILPEFLNRYEKEQEELAPFEKAAEKERAVLTLICQRLEKHA